MKQLEEEFGPDRAIEIQTDDEENVAERVCYDHEDDNESDVTGVSRLPSNDNFDPDHTTCWPQNCRQSVDMYRTLTPSVSFLRSSSTRTSSLLVSDKPSDAECSLFKPLISSTILEKEVGSTSIFHSESRTSMAELQQCSYTQSVLNATNIMCGIGILSTPYALKEGGWLSILLLFVLGAIACYTGILLKRCLESSSELQTYPDIGQAAFGFGGRICIAAILCVELYSSCVEFLIMMSDNLSASFPHIQMDVAGVHLDSYQICAIVSTLVILPTVYLRDLSLLSYISVGGILILALVVLCLLYVGVATEVGFHPSGKAFDYRNLPITIGIYSFCYGGHSVFPEIYSSMKEPSRFPSVLVISFSLAGLLYAGVAVYGFLMFGEATKSQFTLNLSRDLVASNIARWAVAVAPVTKFALALTPVALALEELLPSAQLRSRCISLLIRTSLVVSILVVALAVPYFGSMMALIGSFLVMIVSLVLPCACYMRIEKGRLTKLQIAFCYLIMAVGVSCGIIGTYSAVTSMSK